jgi:hypothetical protein
MSDESGSRASIRSKLRRYEVAVRQILRHEWNPIGFDEDLPEDEYDRYVNRVCAKLMHGEGREQLNEYLWWAETVNIGLPGNRQHTDDIVSLLLLLRDKIETTPNDLP